ncbi:MAG: nitronate monooxygenase [Candidatus Omnitrophica bacterium]|nr:nitronate monooxygenase [Candidatus Omnitrophota bacterium]
MKAENSIPALKIGNLEARVPIVQGGMGVGISGANLASAVANEGAIGVISSVGLGIFDSDVKTSFAEANKQALIDEIRRARSMTKGILGVNIMLALTDHAKHVRAAIDEKIDIVFLGAGLPLKNFVDMSISELKKLHTKFAPKVSSARAADLIFKHWAKNYNHVPDALVVEGPLAGGHLGFKKEDLDKPEFSLEKIVQACVSCLKPYEERFKKIIPVIAAGGIYTGADIYKFLRMGAGAVKMGTRFVATYECDAADEFKQMYVDCKKEDITVIDSPLGLPGRAIVNKFITDVRSGLKKPFECLWKCLKMCDYTKAPYCIGQALYNAKMGNLKDGFAFAGANAYRIKEIISVKDLIETLLKEYKLAAGV